MSMDAVKKVLLDIPSGRVAETFAQWDLNGDGLVTVEEFLAAAVHLDRRTAVAFFKAADRSHDEVLDLGEFEAFAEMLHQARDLGVDFAAQAGTAAGPAHAAVPPAAELAAEPEAAAGELVWWAAAVASPGGRWRIVVGGCR